MRLVRGTAGHEAGREYEVRPARNRNETFLGCMELVEMTLVVKRDVTWNRGSSEKERLSNIAQGASVCESVS